MMQPGFGKAQQLEQADQVHILSMHTQLPNAYTAAGATMHM
jgi:hypothetical protein